MRLLCSLIVISLLDATMAKKHKHRENKHRQKKIDHSLIQTKSLVNASWSWTPSTWESDTIVRAAFGPKQKGQLCDTLTSSVLLFDVDASGGLDWNEFQVFNTAIADVVKDHEKGNPKRQLKDSEEDLGKVYHDITCQCHYTFGQPLDCCHDDMQPPNKPPSQIQVSFDGLNVKGDGRTDADKTYRRNFCDGIMYLLESEGVDLSNANDAIISGLEIDIVDFDVVDVINPNDSNQAEGATAVPTITEAWTEDESSTTETLSSESPNNGNVEEDETIDENNDSSNIESEGNSDESLTKATVSIQSTPSATTTIINTIETTKEVPQFDASTSPVMLSASTTEDANTNNSNVATSATIGILFAVLAAFLAAVMAIIHRKREEKRRLAEFAGEELMDDDLEASSVHNDAVAMETMDGAKVNAESSPEVASTAEENDNDDDSDVLSVVSVDMEHNEECAQISFEKGNEGSVEAKVTVGSTLAAMGVASTVTSRLSSQQQLQQENSVDV